jgi:hypothetical protein
MLGLAMLFLGNSVLGNLNKEATSQKSLGMPFWRIVISAGIIVLVMGPVNILASYIFRDTRTRLTARQVRSHGAVASHKVDVEASSSGTPNPNRRTRYRSFFLGQKRNSLPSYYSHARSGQTDMSQGTPKKFEISSPVHANNPSSPNGSSKYSQSPRTERGYGGDSPELRRPDLARHPAMTAGQAI